MDALTLALGFINTLICVIGLTGNVLVIYVIICQARMKTTTNIFILNLSITDALFLFGLPLIVTTSALKYWIFGDFMCRVYYTLTCISMFTGPFTLTFMAVDRFAAVWFPVKSMAYRTPKCALVQVAAIWLMSLFVMFPIIIFAKIVPQSYMTGADFMGQMNFTPTADLNNWNLLQEMGVGGNMTQSPGSTFLTSVEPTEGSNYTLNDILAEYETKLQNRLDYSDDYVRYRCEVEMPAVLGTASTRAYVGYTFCMGFALPVSQISILYILLVVKLKLNKQKVRRPVRYSEVKVEDAERGLLKLSKNGTAGSDNKLDVKSVVYIGESSKEIVGSGNDSSVKRENHVIDESQHIKNSKIEDNSSKNLSAIESNNKLHGSENDCQTREDNDRDISVNYKAKGDSDKNRSENSSTRNKESISFINGIMMDGGREEEKQNIRHPFTHTIRQIFNRNKSNIQNNGPDKHTEKEKSRGRKSVTGLVTAIITVFVVCWLPYWIFQCVLVSRTSGQIPLWMIYLYQFLTVMSYANSALNPVLYAFTNDNFRKSLKAVFRRSQRSKQQQFQMERSGVSRPAATSNGREQRIYLSKNLGSEADVVKKGKFFEMGRYRTEARFGAGPSSPRCSTAVVQLSPERKEKLNKSTEKENSE